MEFEELNKNDKKIEINGVIEGGKQYDLDVKLPEDNRDVVFGIIKNQYGDPISDAVVKLIEVTKDIHGKERRFARRSQTSIWSLLDVDSFYIRIDLLCSWFCCVQR